MELHVPFVDGLGFAPNQPGPGGVVRASTAPDLHDDAHHMAEHVHNELVLLPGERLVLFLVSLDRAVNVIAVSADRFLEGLRAANDLMSFTGLCRDEPPLDELLPWAGSV